MTEPDAAVGPRSALETPIRNKYHYAQLLGVHNFDMETAYAIGHRRLLNRLALGSGVLCGLNVEVARDGTTVVIAPGVAIDRWGREIVVARQSEPIPIPAEVLRSAVERGGCCEDACVGVTICYHECLGDPVPVLAGDCANVDPCAPSTVREQYRIEFRDECPPRPDLVPRVQDLVAGGRIDYQELARWVTLGRNCTRLPPDPCIPLAAISLIDDDGHPRGDPAHVDIAVRPVVASNAVLMEIILGLLSRDSRPSQYD